jgi:protein-disulfide isomerase
VKPTLALAVTLLASMGAWGSAQRAPADPLATRSKGRADAPVVVYEMADFQCPACRGFVLTIFPTLEREFIATGKVRWVFINFPLTQVHPNAVAAAEVAMCAARQGRFWEAHDLLYAEQGTWGPLAQPESALVALAERAGAGRRQLLSCLKSDSTRAAVERDAQLARRSGARASPSFYIHGGLLEGSPPDPASFRMLLDSIYRDRTDGRPR